MAINLRDIQQLSCLIHSFPENQLNVVVLDQNVI
jgi:hypothetical protein